MTPKTKKKWTRIYLIKNNNDNDLRTIAIGDEKKIYV